MYDCFRVMFNSLSLRRRHPRVNYWTLQTPVTVVYLPLSCFHPNVRLSRVSGKVSPTLSFDVGPDCDHQSAESTESVIYGGCVRRGLTTAWMVSLTALDFESRACR